MSAPPPYPPSKYVMLNEQGNLRPPPYRRKVPHYHSTHRSGGGCCLRCICCCYCFLIILIFVLVGLSIFFYSMFQPRVPAYKIDNFGVNAFDVQSDFGLYAEFSVTVKADNPNDHIGFTYGKDSSVKVLYQDSLLCSGKLPSFHQPHNNSTMIKVTLTGKSEFGSGMQEALMENRDKGRIPLVVMVKAPVSLVVGEFPMRQFVVFVNCSLVVNNLSPNKQISILSATYSYGVGL